MSNEFPRRCSMLRWVAAERSIYDATQVVERMGADIRLTEAVILLGQARDRVADYVDGVNAPPPAQQSTPPVPEEMPETVRRTIAEIREVDGEYRLSDVHFTAQWLADENKRLADRLDARERENTELKERLELSEFACRHNGDYMNELEAARVSATARAEQAERDRATLAAILNVVDVPAHNAAVLTSGVDMLEYMRAMQLGVASSSRGSADHA